MEKKESITLVDKKSGISIQDKKMFAAYKRLAEFKEYLSKLEEYVIGRAKEGVVFEDWELVSGKRSYSWGDKDKITTTLTNDGWSISDITSLKSVSAIKKMIGETKFKEIENEISTTKHRPTLKKIKT